MDHNIADEPSDLGSCVSVGLPEEAAFTFATLPYSFDPSFRC